MIDAVLALGRFLFLGLLLLFLGQLYRLLARDLAGAAAARDRPVAGREPRLVAVAGQGMAAPGRTYPIDGELTLGRLPDNTIQLQDAACSSHHARLWREGDRCFVEDLGSTNGTAVDGRPLAPHTPTELRERVRLSLGETVLRFER